MPFLSIRRDPKLTGSFFVNPEGTRNICFFNIKEREIRDPKTSVDETKTHREE